MRSWYPIPAKNLDMLGLLGEHRELHCIYNIITQNRNCSYSKHPETNRWRNHLVALAVRHDHIVQEINRKKKSEVTSHRTPIFEEGEIVWPELIEPIDKMRIKLMKKIITRRK